MKEFLKQNWFKIGILLIGFLWVVSLLVDNKSDIQASPEESVEEVNTADSFFNFEGEPAPPPSVIPSIQKSKPAKTPDYTCSYNAYNCSDFRTHAEAQRVYELCGGVFNDVHDFDRDNDGSACESLP